MWSTKRILGSQISLRLDAQRTNAKNALQLVLQNSFRKPMKYLQKKSKKVGNGSLCLKLQETRGRSKDDKKAIETLQRTETFDGEPYEVGMLWNDNPRHLPKNFFKAMGRLKSLERRIEKDPVLKDRYEETIKMDLATGFVRKLATVEIESTTMCFQWYLPHHPLVNPNKPEKVRRV